MLLKMVLYYKFLMKPDAVALIEAFLQSDFSSLYKKIQRIAGHERSELTK